MKRNLFLFALSVFLLAAFAACGVQQVAMTPAEVKLMTTRQIEADPDLVYNSVLSLLQSEGYLISNTVKETGMVTASKQIDNKNAELSMFLFGSAKQASTADMTVFVEPLNNELTEVRMTIYEGSVNTTAGYWGTRNTSTKNNMVQNAEVYTTWFNNLRAEVERRKALR